MPSLLKAWRLLTHRKQSVRLLRLILAFSLCLSFAIKTTDPLLQKHLQEPQPTPQTKPTLAQSVEQLLNDNTYPTPKKENTAGVEISEAENLNKDIEARANAFIKDTYAKEQEAMKEQSALQAIAEQAQEQSAKEALYKKSNEIKGVNNVSNSDAILYESQRKEASQTQGITEEIKGKGFTAQNPQNVTEPFRDIRPKDAKVNNPLAVEPPTHYHTSIMEQGDGANAHLLEDNAIIPQNAASPTTKGLLERIRESRVFGKNYPQFYHKGSEAIEHLLQKRSGQVKGAFHKEGIGDLNKLTAKDIKDKIASIEIESMSDKELVTKFQKLRDSKARVNENVFSYLENEIKQREKKLYPFINSDKKDYSYDLEKELKNRGLMGLKDSDLENIAKEINNILYLPSYIRKNIEQDLNIKPIKDFGTNYAEFYHDGANAVKKLLAEKQGQVAGAFYDKRFGDVGIVWGVQGTAKSDGWGIAKIAKYHPEALEKMEEMLKMPIIEQSENRIKLSDGKYFMSIRKDFNGEKQNWVLIAFEKKESKSVSGRRTNLSATQSASEKTTSQNTHTANSSKDKIKIHFKIQDAPKESQLIQNLDKVAPRIADETRLNNLEPSLKEARTRFKLRNKDKENGKLFDKVIVVAQQLGVKFDNKGTSIKGELGHFNPETNTAKVFAKGDKEAEIILHELIHSVTNRALHTNPKDLTPLQVEAISDIKNIFEALSKDRKFKQMYALSNVDEMLSELSNKEFRTMLRGKNILQRFYNAIAKIIFKRNDNYDNLENALYKLIDNYNIEGKGDSTHFTAQQINDTFYKLEQLNDKNVFKKLIDSALDKTLRNPLSLPERFFKNTFIKPAKQKLQQ